MSPTGVRTAMRGKVAAVWAAMGGKVAAAWAAMGGKVAATAALAASLAVFAVAARWAGSGAEDYEALAGGIEAAFMDGNSRIMVTAETSVFGISEHTFTLYAMLPGRMGTLAERSERELYATASALIKPLLSAAFGLQKSRFTVQGPPGGGDGGSNVSLALSGSQIPALLTIGMPSLAGAVALSASHEAFEDAILVFEAASGVQLDAPVRVAVQSLEVAARRDGAGRIEDLRLEAAYAMTGAGGGAVDVLFNVSLAFRYRDNQYVDD